MIFSALTAFPVPDSKRLEDHLLLAQRRTHLSKFAIDIVLREMDIACTQNVLCISSTREKKRRKRNTLHRKLSWNFITQYDSFSFKSSKRYRDQRPQQKKITNENLSGALPNEESRHKPETACTELGGLA